MVQIWASRDTKGSTDVRVFVCSYCFVDFAIIDVRAVASSEHYLLASRSVPGPNLTVTKGLSKCASRYESITEAGVSSFRVVSSLNHIRNLFLRSTSTNEPIRIDVFVAGIAGNFHIAHLTTHELSES